MSKPKIEAIFPLTAMQSALLFHSLHAADDQGFLQVQCCLEGALNREMLESAWQKTAARHAALRTSVHWKDIEKPVQVVHPEAVIPIAFHDWQQFSPQDQTEKLAALKTGDRTAGLNLSSAPVTRISLIRVSETEHWLLWSCHHILLDGWSAAVILRDVFAFYGAAVEGKMPRLEAAPGYKSYLAWQQRQDLAAAANFWKNTLQGLRSPSLVAASMATQNGSQAAFSDLVFSLPKAETEQLQAFARRHRITVGTLVQGVWALLLCRICGVADAVFGTTVSGRPADLPNVEFMAGMFVNVVPVRASLEPEGRISEWLQNFQTRQAEGRLFEHVTLDQITTWTEWPGHLPLFDSLLVLENFPWEDIERGGLAVRGFTGGFTTTYPLTLMVKPGAAFEFLIKSDASQIPGEVAAWLRDQMLTVFKTLENNELANVDEVLNKIADPPPHLIFGKNGEAKESHFTKIKPPEAHTAPTTPAELQLARIWEKVLGLHPIGITDNFFELGGTSLLAVRLFAEIQKQMGRNLPPITLLQHPTVQSLAGALADEDLSAEWESLVPLQVSGSKPPLFCVHGGGGHVFFYHALARRLAPDQPVYALQPVGLDDIKKHHSSIEEMAAHYIGEIKTVQPEGPYALLGYCQSTAVCHEMTKQLQAKGEEVSLLALVDAAPEHFEPVQEATIFDRAKSFAGRFLQNPGYAMAHFFENRKAEAAKEQALRQLSLQDQNLLRMQANLRRLYELYNWEPHDGRVTFIRCGEFQVAENGNWFIPKWKALARGGVEVLDVPGHHLTLFEEPEVAGLAEALREKMGKLFSEKKFPDPPNPQSS